MRSLRLTVFQLFTRKVISTKAILIFVFIYIMCSGNQVRYMEKDMIYGISSKSYKFQTSMALILPAIYKKEYIDHNCEKDFDTQLEKLQKLLSNSFLEDTSYNASSTNSTKINEFVNSY